MPVYDIYYEINSSYGMTDRERPITAENLLETHRKLRTVEALDPQDAYRQMQGENWSPGGQANDLIRSLGLRHTSMSAGDVLHDLKSGCYYECLLHGWRKFRPGEAGNTLIDLIALLEQAINQIYGSDERYLLSQFLSRVNEDESIYVFVDLEKIKALAGDRRGQ